MSPFRKRGLNWNNAESVDRAERFSNFQLHGLGLLLAVFNAATVSLCTDSQF